MSLWYDITCLCHMQTVHAQNSSLISVFVIAAYSCYIGTGWLSLTWSQTSKDRLSYDEGHLTLTVMFLSFQTDRSKRTV